uniref:Uncharacterized protein n=1 Tax=Arundo donax TaxID=35708 RepID=A0A0A8ZIV4_ARUDO
MTTLQNQKIPSIIELRLLSQCLLCCREIIEFFQLIKDTMIAT